MKTTKTFLYAAPVMASHHWIAEEITGLAQQNGATVVADLGGKMLVAMPGMTSREVLQSAQEVDRDLLAAATPFPEQEAPRNDVERFESCPGGFVDFL